MHEGAEIVFEGALHSPFWEYLFDLYFVPVWFALVLRLWQGRLTRREGLLALLFLGHHALEIVQLIFSGGGVQFNCFPRRYFMEAAPLAWGWCAWVLVSAWQAPKRYGLRLVLRLAVVAFFAALVGYENVVKIGHEHRKGSSRDSYVAGEAALPLLLRDWTPPAETPAPERTLGAYLTPRRPVIASNWPYLAWRVRGQVAPGDKHNNPHRQQIDYLFERVDILQINPPKSTDALVGEVRGSRHLWRLYRRAPAR